MELAASLSLEKAHVPDDSNVMYIRSLYNLCEQEVVHKTSFSKEPSLTTLTMKGDVTFREPSLTTTLHRQKENLKILDNQ